jgi:hypothetical protein
VGGLSRARIFQRIRPWASKHRLLRSLSRSGDRSHREACGLRGSLG